MPEVTPSRHINWESGSLLGKSSRGFVPRAIKILSSEIFFAFTWLSRKNSTIYAIRQAGSKRLIMSDHRGSVRFLCPFPWIYDKCNQGLFPLPRIKEYKYPKIVQVSPNQTEPARITVQIE